MTTGIIGLGTMGGAIASALRANGNPRVLGTDYSAAAAHTAAERLGVEIAADNAALARASDVVVLCVKPHQAREVVEGIAAELAGKLLISVCAAVTTADLRAWSGNNAAVVRAMPNTPALIGAGMTVLAPAAGTEKAHLDEAIALFATVGRTAVLDESLMDAATGLSGCGPAYGFLIVEALADAGVKLGIDRATSITLIGSVGPVIQKSEVMLALDRGDNPLVVNDIDDLDRLLGLVSEKMPRFPRTMRRYIAEDRVARRDAQLSLFRGWNEPIEGEGIPHDLESVKAPSLVIHGACDRVIDVSTGRALAARLPDARLEVMEGIGHVPQMEAPLRVAKMIDAFVAEGEARRVS